MARSSKSDASRKPGKGSARQVKSAANADSWQAPSSGRQIVAFWKQNDLGLFGRRPDRFIESWAADSSIDKVVVFELPTTLATLNNWTRLAANPDPIQASEFRLLLSVFFSKYHGELNTEKVHYCTYLQAEEKLNGPAYLRWVLAKLRELRVESPELWLWPICAINDALIETIVPHRVTVDFVDDQRLFPGTESVEDTYTQQYQWLIRKADALVSNSPGLIESFKREFKANVALLENSSIGEGPSSGQSPAPQRPLRQGDQPVVGFVGNMRGRMNVPLMKELMRSHRQVQFVFVGQTHGSDFYKVASREPNARFLGTMLQQEADEISKSFDLAIIPFVNDDLVRSMSPIKAVTFNRLGIPTLSSLELSDDQFKKEFQRAVAGIAGATASKVAPFSNE